MARAKWKQDELDRREQTYRVEEKVCATCKHWWCWIGSGALKGTCNPRYLSYRDSVEHAKETAANGTCGLWTDREANP